MKLSAVIVVAVALAVSAGSARAAIPADGGYSDGLRVVYELPLTPHSAVVRERYYPCRLRVFAFGIAARPVPEATASAWCRYLPTVNHDLAPADGGGTATDDSGGSLLSVPLADWRPL
jgi:hypothetical protein